MFIVVPITIIALLLNLAIIIGLVYLFVLLVTALKKYINSSDARKEKSIIRKSLGETFKDQRTQHKMTQEFIAETLGVSRQAVSKWENGTSDPSTSNLLALAKMIHILLHQNKLLAILYYTNKTSSFIIIIILFQQKIFPITIVFHYIINIFVPSATQAHQNGTLFHFLCSAHCIRNGMRTFNRRDNSLIA